MILHPEVLTFVVVPFEPVAAAIFVLHFSDKNTTFHPYTNPGCVNMVAVGYGQKQLRFTINSLIDRGAA
jgi:hypothetical protein